MSRRAWISLAVVTALLSTTSSAEAANKAWVGQTGSLAGDWNVGANWNPAGVPMPGDVVYTGGMARAGRSRCRAPPRTSPPSSAARRS